MRKILAALVLGTLFLSVPVLAVDAEVAAPAPAVECGSVPAANALQLAPQAIQSTQEGVQLLRWLKGETPVVPTTWLAPLGCGNYCAFICEGCCAIGPNWCACC